MSDKTILQKIQEKVEAGEPFKVRGCHVMSVPHTVEVRHSGRDGLLLFLERAVREGKVPDFDLKKFTAVVTAPQFFESHPGIKLCDGLSYSPGRSMVWLTYLEVLSWEPEDLAVSDNHVPVASLLSGFIHAMVTSLDHVIV